MEKKSFELLRDSETSWWYRGRSHVAARVLVRFLAPSRERAVCDIGAGYGGMLATLLPYGRVAAQEPDALAQESCRKRGYAEVFSVSDITQLPDEHFGLLGLFDVLEHTPDDRAFLRTLHDKLTPNGALALTVPAFQWLWSEHDVAHHHYRRYRRAELTRLLEECGYVVRYGSYWNMLLFFPAALVRLTGKSGSGALQLPSLIDRLMYACVRAESVIVPLFRLPFGTGIVIFAEKKSHV